jgi:hypothetical protein
MKLRAEIVIEIDADDFVVAADHQKRIESILNHVREDYPQASMMLRERKERSAARRFRPEQPSRERTGRLNQYLD